MAEGNVGLGPPTIDGYKYLDRLGGGGFADVYRYRREFPEREVAIKVLRTTVSDEYSRRAFVAEANLMAKVAGHPHIVTIYDASVASDGRPFLVMEYCAPPNFDARLRSGPLPLHDALKTGIQVASAVELAHRESIIHNDIKPANILSSDFGPALTDFGIAVAAASSDEAGGFSPAFAAPEIIGDEVLGDARSDVYSLAATVFALISGRAPFEDHDGRTTKAELMRRALNEPAPMLDAPGVPISLSMLLRQSLDKNPTNRPQTAMSFALGLQQVESELGYTLTEIRLQQAAAPTPIVPPPDADQGARTKVGAGKVVRPDAVGPVSVPPPPLEAPPRAVPAEEPGTVKVDRRAAAPTDSAPAAAVSTPMPKWIVAAAATAIVAIAAVVVGVVATGGGKDARGESSDSTVAATAPPIVDAITPDAVTGLAAQRVDASTVTFTWQHRGGEGLTFLVARHDAGHEGDRQFVKDPQVTISALAEAELPCVSINVITSSGESGASEVVCSG